MNFNPTIKRAALPFMILGAGGAGLVLRVTLYTLGMDSQGLLPRMHLIHLLTVLMTLGVALLLIPCARRLDGSNRFRHNFPASIPGGLSAILASLILLSMGLELLTEAVETLEVVHVGLTLASVFCLAVTGILRFRGKRPMVLFHGLLSAAFAFHMVFQYRTWSANPQLPDYIFHIFACACLTLTAYHRAAFDVGLGKRTVFLFFSLMSVYLCFLSLVGAGDPRFYVAGGIWALGNLCPLDPPKQRKFQNTIRIPDLNER